MTGNYEIGAGKKEHRGDKSALKVLVRTRDLEITCLSTYTYACVHAPAYSVTLLKGSKGKDILAAMSILSAQISGANTTPH